MEGVAITFKGMEDVACKEIKELIGKDAVAKNGYAVFEHDSDDELCRLAYRGQSFIKIAKIIRSFSYDTLTDDMIISEAKKIDISSYLKEGMGFAARSHVCYGAETGSADVEPSLGEGIIYNESIASKPKVNLTDPDLTVLIVIDSDVCHLGIDFSGADIGKRDYRIYAHPSALKAGVAYAAIRIAGVKKKGVLLDPFSGSGTIPIECAHFASGRSLHAFNREKLAFTRFMEYDFDKDDSAVNASLDIQINAFDSQMRHIKSAEKNAKISGINQHIRFSRTEVDWLDTKFDEKSVDWIVTNPPQISKFTAEKELSALYDEFFYQASFVLSKKGRMVVVSTEGRSDALLVASSAKKGMKQKGVHKVLHGKQTEHLLVFERG